MRLLAPALGLTLLLVGASAAADALSRPAPGTFKPADKNQQQQPQIMQPAANIEGSLPSNLGLSVGEKRSFRAGCKGAMANDMSIVQLRVDEKGILTVRGLKRGDTVVTIIGKAGQAPAAADFRQQMKTVKVKVSN